MLLIGIDLINYYNKLKRIIDIGFFIKAAFILIK